MLAENRVVLIAGTRPEAIKLSPVLKALRDRRLMKPLLVSTGQHRDLVAQPLAQLGITPDVDLQLMTAGQTPAAVLGSAIPKLTEILTSLRPRVVCVQGDTATALGGALAAFYAGVPIAHVEAGLRTSTIEAPFPEEGHRRLIARIAAVHYAPTEAAVRTLMQEGVSARDIELTGNTGIDTLKMMEDTLDRSPTLRASLRAEFPQLRSGRPLVLVTTHRRENLGEPLRRICMAVKLIAGKADAEILIPLHPNPAVAETLRFELGQTPHVHLVPPLAYAACVWLMRQATLILTDSGGLQEEAPTIGVPHLVLREETERPEGVRAGVAALVGTDPIRIAGAALAILRDGAVRDQMGRPVQLYGDGSAGDQIARSLATRYAADASRAARRYRTGVVAA